MKREFIKGLIEKTANGGYSVIISTAAVDRQGDTILQSGLMTDNYFKNPVMLWAHDYKSLPVAKALTIDQSNPQRTIMTYEFAPAEANPMAGYVKALVDGGFLNAVSVGFIPLKRDGNTILQWELLEVSFVPVPANQEALQLMRSKGIAEDVIDKFFILKEETKIETKGAVSDELAAEEAIELKWNKWEEVCEVLGAMWSVYFDPETGVEQFSSLLLEAISLLMAVAQSDGADDDSAEAATAGMKEKMKSLVNKESALLFIQKIGAQHSKKTKENLQLAIDHTNSSLTVLQAMLQTQNEAEAEQDGEKTGEVVPATETTEKNEVVKADTSELKKLLEARKALRGEQTGTQTALKLLNDFIEEKRQAAATQ